MTPTNERVRLRVSPQVARIVDKKAPRKLQLSAARGALPLSGQDLLTALLFLYHGDDEEIRREVLATLASLPGSILRPVAGAADSPPQLLHFIAQVWLKDPDVMAPLVANPATAEATLLAIARRAEAAVVSLLGCNDVRLAACPQLAQAIIANPLAERSLKVRLGWQEAPAAPPLAPEAPPAETANADDSAEEAQEGEEWDEGGGEELNMSKYQLSLEMPVSEKIKMALTGDKEWRSILLRDSNKLVSAAVLKNPRITDGEVLGVARNRSSSDDLIRIILLNNEWVKNTEIKKALVIHPRTPLPKALHFMAVFSEKELKQLAKSRNVSQVIVNNARRVLMAKEKKK